MELCGRMTALIMKETFLALTATCILKHIGILTQREDGQVSSKFNFHQALKAVGHRNTPLAYLLALCFSAH